MLEGTLNTAQSNPIHLTGALDTIVLKGPEATDNRESQLTAATMPEEDRIDQGPKKATLYPPQKENVEEVKAKPHNITGNDARKRTHQSSRSVSASHPSYDYQISYKHSSYWLLHHTLGSALSFFNKTPPEKSGRLPVTSCNCKSAATQRWSEMRKPCPKQWHHQIPGILVWI